MIRFAFAASTLPVLLAQPAGAAVCKNGVELRAACTGLFADVVTKGVVIQAGGLAPVLAYPGRLDVWSVP